MGTTFMKKLLAATIVVQSLFLTAAYASEGNISRLMNSKTLNAAISASVDIQIIDIRHEKYVKKGTIPGAVAVTYKKWRGPADRPGQPPSEAALEAILGENGIDINKPIVIFNQTGKTMQTGQAAYVYWLLKTAGAQQAAILNGGFKAWNAADWPVALTPMTNEPITVDVTYSFEWWAEPMDIFGVATGQLPGAILDARLDSQVKRSVKTGKPMKSMPLARFIPTSLVVENLTPKRLTTSAMDEFRSALEGRGINLDGEMLISICQTGELSALSWFYASEIVGIDNVQYYPDALQGWVADGGLLFGLSNDN
ncbi:rhodanese-like domain-containing protein [Rhodobacteraceae bacterium]|nr:rhodanese-like domain-containing protein [Paracoccaceae bacterium]